MVTWFIFAAYATNGYMFYYCGTDSTQATVARFIIAAFATLGCNFYNCGRCNDELMLNVLRCQLTYYGQVVTNTEARFSNSLRPRKPEDSLGRTAQDGHLDFHTAPEL